MPKDNIERAIKRGTGDAKEGNVFEEVMYEGYAPHGIALMISVVTDNRNRAVAEIRHILNRYGGSMAEAGSVAWQFKRICLFRFSLRANMTRIKFLSWLLKLAQMMSFSMADRVEIVGPVEAFKAISDALKAADIHPEEAELRMIPNNETELTPGRYHFRCCG